MLVLVIRTDKPESEIGLFEDDAQLAYESWQAHRLLAETIHLKIDALLKNSSKQFGDLNGIVAYQGPGSFTGLRIGLSVANALAYGLGTPIVAAQGDDWVKAGIKRLQEGANDTVALPHYGAPVHITKPKH